MTDKTIAFIGLGVMGFPMAGHFAQAGYTTHVFNRNKAKRDAWIEKYSGTAHATPGSAAAQADIILCCVGNDDDVRSVFLGADGIIENAQAGAIVVDHTTTSAQLAKEMHYACAEKQLNFIDAPVSGGQQGAENGQLTIMCGGQKDIYQKVETHLATYAKKCLLMGDVGAGQQTKMVNQICVAGVVQGLAEGLLLAEKSGLDRQQVVDVISQGAAQSWQMDNRHQTMIAEQYDHGFAIDWMIKDLGFCLDEAKTLDIDLEMTETLLSYYQEMQAAGHGRWDTSCLYARLQKKHET